MDEVFCAEIKEMNLLGNGIVKLDGCVVFVIGAIDGDTVTAKITQEKKNFKIAEIISIDKPSPYRIEAKCGAFSKCGGCKLSNISYEHELSIKKAGIEASLRRGGLGEMSVSEIFHGEPERYRNKAVFRFFTDGFGFSEEKTDNIVKIGDCLICPDVFSKIADFTYNFFKEKAPSYLYLRQSSTGEISCVLGSVDADDAKIRTFAENVTKEFPEICGVMRKNGIHPENGEPLISVTGNNVIHDSFLGMNLEVSPNSFFQVNHDVAEMLCRKVAQYAAPEKNGFGIDLYCGTGIIGMSVAKLYPDVLITGVEINPDAVENAKANAENNGISNIGFFCGDSGEFAKKIYGSADFIIIDPPRAGCSDNMIKELLRIKPQRIVYVSCNPDSLARDLKKLTEQKYKIDDICAADLFPRTRHCESIVKLTRIK